MALISRDLPPSPLTSARPEPQILVRHGPKGNGFSLNTFARSLLSGRTAPHTCFDTTHRRRKIRRNGRRFVTSDALTTSITTPGFWVLRTQPGPSLSDLSGRGPQPGQATGSGPISSYVTVGLDRIRRPGPRHSEQRLVKLAL